MRFPEPVRMADDAGDGPVWARTSSRRRGGGGAIFTLLFALLALFGALMIVLGVKERSVAEGGAMVDGWIATGWNKAKALTGQADEAAAEAADETAAAAEKAGDALESGVDAAAEELAR